MLNATIILIFRDPVKRLISDFTHKKVQEKSITPRTKLESLILDQKGNVKVTSPLLQPSELEMYFLFYFPV